MSEPEIIDISNFDSNDTILKAKYKLLENKKRELNKLNELKINEKEIKTQRGIKDFFRNLK